MPRSMYLINPKGALPSYFGAEVYESWGLPAAQSIADLAIATVAAMVPEDFELELCDEYVQPVDLDTDAEIVGLTGKITQASRMLELAREFRRRGKTVVIGGPYASLSPEAVRDSCDVLVRGELEDIAEEVFADLAQGTAREEYEGDKPDLARSPVPRWDLYPNGRALLGCVQTSRGCPFQCEFCDVIQYLGRQQRHKPVASILAELDELDRHGYRAVFLADDNFTVYRRRAKEVLAAVAEWNARRDEPFSFGTQVSIDAARDPEILELCAQAGLSWVFIGIETPNEASLKETGKRQNVGVDLGEQIQRFLDHGISVTAGMIVGFDSDGPDIFQRQYDFAMSLPVPMFSLGALVAPAATPLFDRMEESGRLVRGGSEVAAAPWDTNILPAQMSREELFEGLRWLCNQLYDPQRFGDRVVAMIERLGEPRGPHAPGRTAQPRRGGRPVDRDGFNLIRKLIRRGPAERRMWQRIQQAQDRRPETAPYVLDVLARYAQVRAMYDAGAFWEPELAHQPVPVTTGGGTAGESLVGIGG